jgi:hypothetical protein
MSSSSSEAAVAITHNIERIQHTLSDYLTTRLEIPSSCLQLVSFARSSRVLLPGAGRPARALGAAS